MALVRPHTAELTKRLQNRNAAMQDAYGQIIREYGKRDGERRIKVALKTVFSSMIRDVKLKTPVKSGKLRRSVRVVPRKYRGFLFSAQLGYYNRQRVYAALGIEFGSVKHREQKPIRLAIQRNQEDAVNMTANALADQLVEEAQKAVKRRRVRSRVR